MMDNTINGRTPEEIKKALRICSGKLLDYCDACNYCNWSSDCACNSRMCADALEYIQQLEYHIGELTEKVAQLEAAQPKWVSVEERLPNVGEKVMVCGVKNGMQVGSFRGLSNPVKNRMWWWKKDTILEVTHWMPLPELPKEVNDNGKIIT